MAERWQAFRKRQALIEAAARAVHHEHAACPPRPRRTRWVRSGFERADSCLRGAHALVPMPHDMRVLLCRSQLQQAVPTRRGRAACACFRRVALAWNSGTIESHHLGPSPVQHSLAMPLVDQSTALNVTSGWEFARDRGRAGSRRPGSFRAGVNGHSHPSPAGQR